MKILFTALILLITSALLAQYEGVYEIPLPEKFKEMRVTKMPQSTPNPNYPEFVNDTRKEIVWKHSTSITAKETFEILETGAYLLNNGEWKLRVAFSPKETKKYFDAATLELKEGDVITFKNNDRYSTLTQTGWNFWYVIARTPSGEFFYAYEILHTMGKMKDGTEVLPISPSKSTIQWTGKAGDSDYSLKGTLKPSFAGSALIIRDGVFLGGNITIDLTSIQSDHESLTKHLKSKDFFFVKKYPNAHFGNITDIQYGIDGKSKLQGTLSILGNELPCNADIQMIAEEKTVHILTTLRINRVEYGMNYASSVDTKTDDYSISDFFEVSCELIFSKDFPGSNSWNTVTPHKP